MTAEARRRPSGQRPGPRPARARSWRAALTAICGLPSAAYRPLSTAYCSHRELRPAPPPAARPPPGPGGGGGARRGAPPAPPAGGGPRGAPGGGAGGAPPPAPRPPPRPAAGPRPARAGSWRAALTASAVCRLLFTVYCLLPTACCYRVAGLRRTRCFVSRCLTDGRARIFMAFLLSATLKTARVRPPAAPVVQ